MIASEDDRDEYERKSEISRGLVNVAGEVVGDRFKGADSAEDVQVSWNYEVEQIARERR